MRIRRVRRGKAQVEKRDGLVFCSGWTKWMGGWRPSYVHAAEWVDGAATNRHQPQAKLYAAAKIRQLRFFSSFFLRLVRRTYRGGDNVTYE